MSPETRGHIEGLLRKYISCLDMGAYIAEDENERDVVNRPGRTLLNLGTIGDPDICKVCLGGLLAADAGAEVLDGRIYINGTGYRTSEFWREILRLYGLGNSTSLFFVASWPPHLKTRYMSLDLAAEKTFVQLIMDAVDHYANAEEEDTL